MNVYTIFEKIYLTSCEGLRHENFTVQGHKCGLFSGLISVLNSYKELDNYFFNNTTTPTIHIANLKIHISRPVKIKDRFMHQKKTPFMLFHV